MGILETLMGLEFGSSESIKPGLCKSMAPLCEDSTVISSISDGSFCGSYYS